MVERIYVEKRPGLRQEADALLGELRDFLRIASLRELRILNRYDVEGLGAEQFAACVPTVFSEPQVDQVYGELPEDADAVFAVEYLPGQFDQRADSAAQCIQLITRGERPAVRTARVYLLSGALSPSELAAVKKYTVNPVEAREASLAKPETLRQEYPRPGAVPVLTGFTAMDDAALSGLLDAYGLAMDLADLRFCRDYFRSERRDPTETELRLIDTYWSDHCRHTTFLTTIDAVRFGDPAAEEAYGRYLAARQELGRTRPVTLMDMGTLGAKLLKKRGLLQNLDESEEINACTVRLSVDENGREAPWLLLFKNETHNHPTEIEPFGGAATCIGGAIRDPLSGRAYVYGAMRLTGAADPRRPVEDTIPGKLPQRKLVTAAAAGYSSYGNQIGLATGLVDELYHPGYAAKHMEVGAVIAAAPAGNVRRETPAPGDVILLLGGRTGRDGCGGATGSSKAHDVHSLESCGAEVQKGNAPEERKLQRLFRNPEAARMIKRCNDFGAGGVSVAIGELADGLDIDLDAVPKKYDGLDGTELAISESQERMAVVVAPEDAARFLALADGENLEATPVAVVKAERRMRLHWNGQTVAELSRDFLDSNGAEKHIEVEIPAPRPAAPLPGGSFSDRMRALAADLNVCSRRGLAERFDSTIGAGTVLMPFGGKRQLTPPQAMVQKLPVADGRTDTCSFMAYGCNPSLLERDPFRGAYLAVVESVAKLAAAGAPLTDTCLTFQEYFPKPGHDPKRWGLPAAALLGAFRAQEELGFAAIGGKDSMSGSFEKLDVPPTLISFAVTAGKTSDVLSPEFKAPGRRVVWLRPETGADGLPRAESLRQVFAEAARLRAAGKISAAWTPVYGGAAEGILKMCLGNGIGFVYDEKQDADALFAPATGSLLLELTDETETGVLLGRTTAEESVVFGRERLSLDALQRLYEGTLESVYPTRCGETAAAVPAFSFRAERWDAPAVKTARPRVLIPVFPGTNCEYDAARALAEGGSDPEIFVLNNLTAAGVNRSAETFARRLRESQMVFLPGGFSGGDEPDGSAKLITAFFRSAAVREATMELLDGRGGLICGICNGFQALVKLGLVPYGKIVEPSAESPTLTFNRIGRHQSRLVRTRIASNRSPWLRRTEPGEIYTVPISHGEGRFLASDALLASLAANGQIATQYVDDRGEPTYDILYNPNGSAAAVEGITSPDGRVFGKMGHSERMGAGLYRNVPGAYDMGMFRAAAEYFK